jgi:predicted 3-demethylubiquinone-9 3-methyltransferase (glyoxalase superfamily)
MATTPKIKPSLWFAGNAEEAINFYTLIFPSSTINHVSRYTEAGKDKHQMEVGSVMSMEFTLHSQSFNAINGPPIFQFTPAISFTISCDDQEELDHVWEKLGDGKLSIWYPKTQGR